MILSIPIYNNNHSHGIINEVEYFIEDFANFSIENDESDVHSNCCLYFNIILIKLISHTFFKYKQTLESKDKERSNNLYLLNVNQFN